MRFILKHRLPIAVGFFCICLLFGAAPSQIAGADTDGSSGTERTKNPTSCCNCTVSNFCPCNLVSGFMGCTITHTPEGQTCTTVGHAQCLVQQTQN